MQEKIYQKPYLFAFLIPVLCGSIIAANIYDSRVYPISFFLFLSICIIMILTIFMLMIYVTCVITYIIYNLFRIRWRARNFGKIVIFYAFCFPIMLILISPNYSNYTVRTHVAEGLSAANGLKMQIGDYYEKYGVFPDNNFEAGITEPIVGRAFKSITSNNGQIIITYNKKVLDNGEIILTPTVSDENQRIIWTCATNTTNKRKMISMPDMPIYCRS